MTSDKRPYTRLKHLSRTSREIEFTIFIDIQFEGLTNSEVNKYKLDQTMLHFCIQSLLWMDES